MTQTGWIVLAAVLGAATLLLATTAAGLVLWRRRAQAREIELRKKLAALSAAHKERGAELKSVRGENTKLRSQAGGLPDIKRSIESLVRLTAVEPGDLPFPQRLSARRFRILSQGEEDGVIWSIFQAAGVTGRRFVELGCGDNGGNSGFLATDMGWTGLMVDGSESLVKVMRGRLRGDRTRVLQAWIRREDVNDLIRANGLDGEVDLLSIDIDGNDYWVWEAIDACSPRVLVMEYNTSFGPEASVTIPYDPDFVRDPGGPASGLYYGASLTALARLARRKGYRLVAAENVNGFFIRDDVAPEIPAADVSDVYRVYDKEARRVEAMDAGLFDTLERAGLELVEIPE